MNNHKKIKISLFALIVIVFISSITIAHPVYTTNTITGNPNCINENDLQKSVSFKVKKPILLPQDYKFQCGTVTTHEIHLLYGSQTLPSSFSNNASLPSIINGQLGSNSVSLDLVDVKGILGDEMFASKVGDTTQRIIDTYHDANQKNPILQTKLLQINGKTAWANDPCPSCGQQIAYFPDGKVLRHSFNIPARIQFYDENGVLYTFESNISLEELKKMAESTR